jgi:hypothetical protein
VHSKVGQGTEFVLAVPLSDAVRDNDDVVQSSTDEASMAMGAEATTELSPQNNGGAANTTPIIPLAAGAPSATTTRLRN